MENKYVFVLRGWCLSFWSATKLVFVLAASILALAVVLSLIQRNLTAAPLSSFLPPTREGAATYGCTASLARVDEKSDRWWYIRAWVEYKDRPKWTTLLGIVYPHERKKAMKVCDKWFEELKKEKGHANH